MKNLFMMFAVAVVFMIQDASATALPPVNTNDVSPSWVASGSREVIYASNGGVRHVFEVNVPNFKTEVLCNDFIAAQEVLALSNSSRGNLGTQVFSAICSKQR